MKRVFTHTLLIPWHSLMVAQCSLTSSRATVSSSVEYLGSEYPETCLVVHWANPKYKPFVIFFKFFSLLGHYIVLNGNYQPNHQRWLNPFRVNMSFTPSWKHEILHSFVFSLKNRVTIKCNYYSICKEWLFWRVCSYLKNVDLDYGGS
jgi:hypothetical protein